ncbi:MAG: C10 family peptidase [Bacteroidetes bacterium]|nr:C10 family peptidase [Bacteroidota bacterium]
MKKYFLIYLSCLLVFQISSRAAHLDSQTAARIAKNFYYERCYVKSGFAYDDLSTGAIIPISCDGVVTLYVVNLNKPGFVVVSADDSVIPVLAYSFDGRYTGAGLPPSMQEWIEKYSQQIKGILDGSLETKFRFEEEWQRLLSQDTEKLILYTGREVEPMLTSTWDQGSFYNEMCPEDPAGPTGHCYAGCVATAMGQVMNYFRWPINGTGSYTYECPPYGTLNADFENTTYRWDEMPLFAGRSNLPVAELLYHLGVSVDMVYGPNGSGMYNHKAAYSLRTYFKYSPQTQYVYRDSTTMNWDSLLVSHLERNIPMYYAGWSVPNINGHAFVCDGYQSGNYYHFNWGWSGSYDGYFYTDNLSPGGSNFNLAQEVIINAVPDTNQYSYPVFCDGNKILGSIDGTIDDGSGPNYNYQSGSSCSWLIAPDDSVMNISISFVRFSTQPNDILTVYDGENASAPILGSYSGGTIPAELISSGDRLFLAFETTEPQTAPGWLLSYTCELPVYCSGMQMLTDPSGVFSDGSGPAEYHNGTNCIWVINPSTESDVLAIEFTSFSTEEGHDWVKIYDYVTQDLLGEFSGDSLPDPIFVESNKAFITFSTNSTVTRPGWEASWHSFPIGMPDDIDNIGFEVFPVPATNSLNILIYAKENINACITLLNLQGQEVLSLNLEFDGGKYEKTINVEDLPAGVYAIILQTNERRITKKVVIR